MTPSIADADARLVLSLAGGLTQEFTLSKASVTIGRRTTCDLVLRDWTVSRTHARIERTPEGYELQDLGSVNGTRVNDTPSSRRLLVPGDVVQVGDSVLRFEAGRPEGDPDMTLSSTEPSVEATPLDMPVHMRLEESSVPRVVVHTAARTWEVPLVGDRLTIGRAPDNDIRLDVSGVSRHHAVMERRAEACGVRDLQSRNGTWVAGARISTTQLRDGETVRIGRASLLFKRGLSQDDLDGDDPDGSAVRRPVVVIPGFAGSNLWRGSQQIWPTMRTLANSEWLSMDHRLEARGIVDEVVVIPNLIRLDQYSVLTGYLRESLGYEPGKDLLEFGYDFRQDNRASARMLASAIDAWNVSAPVTLVAHSMGCLIARYYIERLGGHRKVERVILIGGPHAGTPYAFASLLRGPNLLPLGLMNLRLREMLATFPSWYQILPTDGCISSQQAPLDVLTDESWLPEPNRPLLRDAREFRRELGGRSSVPTTCVFGYGIKTITEAAVERNSGGTLHKADLVVSENGDGTIPVTSAVLKGAEIHPVRQHHGSLYVDKDVRMRLKLELTR